MASSKFPALLAPSIGPFFERSDAAITPRTGIAGQSTLEARRRGLSITDRDNLS